MVTRYIQNIKVYFKVISEVKSVSVHGNYICDGHLFEYFKGMKWGSMVHTFMYILSGIP